MKSLPKTKKQWVVWKREPVLKDGIPTGQTTKIPYQVNGMKADSTHESTWNTYAAVKKVSHLFSGIGIVFDGSLLGVDLDHVLSAGIIEDAVAKKFVESAKSYTEISPSGDGLHVYFKLSEPLELKAHAFKPNEKYKYECYNEKRYFTVTENIFEKFDTLRTIDAGEAETLLSILGYPWTKSPLKVGHFDTVPNHLTDEQVLQIMFRASNGKKAEKLYEGDNAKYNNDASAGDSAFCCMLAFYTNKDAKAMERIWMASPRGKRDKVQTRADYRRATISHAIEITEEAFKPDRSFDNAEEYVKVKVGKVETIPLITENIQVFLNSYKDFAGCFRFNEFAQKIEYKCEGIWRDYKDSDAIIIQMQISRAHPIFSRVKKNMVEDAIVGNALRHSYDPVRDYFNGLVWDKVPRLDTWLSKAYATPDDEYHTAVGSNWMKGATKRAMQPGCKFDYVLVLESPQGMKKSMSLAALGNPWHAETTLTPDNKDFFMLMFGNLIVEFSEGETLSRADIKRLKAIITMQHDDLRLPYDRTVSRHYRRCVFAMTTNEERYLKDDTGNRRWWPVRVGDKIDVEWIKENRDQLFAEAFHRGVTLNEKTYEVPEAATLAAQAERMIVDPMAEKVAEWYVMLSDPQRDEGVTTRQVFMGINPAGETFGKEMTRVHEMQLSAILKGTLFLERERKMVSGVQRTLYRPSEKTREAFDLTAMKDDLFYGAGK